MHDDDEIPPGDYWAEQEADDQSVEEASGNEGATINTTELVWCSCNAFGARKRRLNISRDQLAQHALKRHESGATEEARLQLLLSGSAASSFPSSKDCEFSEGFFA